MRTENEKKKLEGNRKGADITNGKAVALQLEGERETNRDTFTDNQVAKKAGVGTGTVARYNKVMKSDDEELKAIEETQTINLIERMKENAKY